MLKFLRSKKRVGNAIRDDLPLNDKKTKMLYSVVDHKALQFLFIPEKLTMILVQTTRDDHRIA